MVIYPLYSLLLLLITACQPGIIPLRGSLPIHVPAVLTTGMPITVRVGPVEVIDGTGIGLVMMGKYGPYTYHSTFQSGMAEFFIPGEHTRQAGYLAFVAAAEEARGEASLLLQPHVNRHTRTSIIEQTTALTHR